PPRRDVLGDAVEQGGELVVLPALLERPVRREDVVRAPPEEQRVRALVRRGDLRAGDLVEQRRLPPAEREPALRVLLRPAGRLPDEVEGREQLDLDASHVPLPWSRGRRHT